MIHTHLFDCLAVTFEAALLGVLFRNPDERTDLGRGEVSNIHRKNKWDRNLKDQQLLQRTTAS